MKENFDAFKSEVYKRRDLAVAKQKKQRSIFLSLTVPVLLIGVFFAVNPAFRLSAEKGIASNDMALIESESTSLPVIQSVVADYDGDSRAFTEEDATEIATLLFGDTFNLVFTDQSLSDISDEVKPEGNLISGGLCGKIVFTVRMEGANPVQFILEGVSLTRNDTGEERLLEKADKDKLMEYLFPTES